MKLRDAGRHYRPEEITTDDILYLYNNSTTKENVTKQNLRILARFIQHYTGKDVVKQTCLLWNRKSNISRTWITPEEFTTLYKAAEPVDRLVLVLGVFMGLRREEMCNIRDVDIFDGELLIHGKGHTAQGFVERKEIPTEVDQEIRRFRDWKLGKKSENDGHLLQCRENSGVKLHAVAPSTVNYRLTKLGKKCGIKVTPHSLRRLYATVLWHELGVDVQTLKELMRHADAATTMQCYIDAYEGKKKEATMRFSAFMANVKG